ncbi:MAG: peptide chain release factor H [Proteobacteria bacterium]|nr:MAG: peptide chain release factor H [Pseudomonadota bacterium]
MTTIQLTAGTGPRECAYVVHQVLQKLIESAGKVRIEGSILSSSPLRGSGPCGLQSVVIEFKGQGSAVFAEEWIGTIQWAGQSPYRPNHKRKNWFIAVHRVELQVSDLKSGGPIAYQAMRSQGPGGQNVNKTNSAVRATHIESGISVSSRESRSLVQNRKNAEQKISEIIRERKETIESENEDRKWRSQLEVNRGSPVKVFKGDGFVEVRS